MGLMFVCLCGADFAELGALLDHRATGHGDRELAPKPLRAMRWQDQQRALERAEAGLAIACADCGTEEGAKDPASGLPWRKHGRCAACHECYKLRLMAEWERRKATA